MGKSAAMMDLDELFQHGMRWLSTENNSGVGSALAYHYFHVAYQKEPTWAKSTVYMALIELKMGDQKSCIKHCKKSLKQSKSFKNNKEYQTIAKTLLQIPNPVESFTKEDRSCITKVCETLDILREKEDTMK